MQLHHMVKKIGCAIGLLFCIMQGMAQKQNEEDYVGEPEKTNSAQTKKSWKDRLVFGGNLGGTLGTYSYLQINPTVGYKVTDWWVNGIGLNYIYSGSRGYSQHVYGASAWSRAYIQRSIMLHTEFEYLTLNLRTPMNQNYTGNAPVWLVGGGYQSQGNGFGIGVLVLFDLLQHPNSPYTNPIFRIGGSIGF